MTPAPPTAARDGRQDSGPAPASISSLIARNAALTPDAVAVVDGARTLGYAALDAHANRLAHHLIACGVRPDDPVGVCLYRGADLVVALLAVWRAGACYVPHDPDLPPRRLARQLRATGTRVVLAETAAAGAVAAAGARAVVPDAIRAVLDMLPGTPPDRTCDPAGAAYVVHTSGRDREPRNVVVSHAGITNRVAWSVDTFRLGPADRMLQKTTTTFDAHCWEVFAPLVSGGVLVLAPIGVESDPAALAAAVRAHRITVLQVVPPVLRLLVEEPALAGCEALRLVLSAGEPLHAELVQRLLGRVRAEVWNAYGTAACSIDVTAHRVDPAQRTGPVPIGRPLPGVRTVVTGADGRPVTAGEPGELLVGGVGVARGYLGEPALTAASFVPDPQALDGSRLYRTGDRVRLRPDGALEFLGRIAEHVTVDGTRIDPACVEQALLAHPGVGNAAVTTYEAPDGEIRLAAHVAARPGLRLPELQAFLAERLRPQEAPSAFMLLDSLPLSPTGKVDRRALPLPGSPGADGRPAHRAPLTPAERAVAAAWHEVLPVDTVGLDDDFFGLGGSSLQLTKLVSRLQPLAGREIRLRDFIRATTLAAQAELLV